ncbi:hypothetical protein CSKR_113809 [Clonorchis sinensis]|uniref:Uncharacterized protein n=1 Tax=Clonorchis sinensis TaxID=79923 RepID=A0A3R7FT61_CLOSI|nr:hypothetical protein CSKR_113809 [Clonorchis sinensis]
MLRCPVAREHSEPCISLPQTELVYCATCLRTSSNLQEKSTRKALNKSAKCQLSIVIHRKISLAEEGTKLLTGRSVVRTQPLHFDCSGLGLGNLAVPQLLCFIRMA